MWHKSKKSIKKERRSLWKNSLKLFQYITIIYSHKMYIIIYYPSKLGPYGKVTVI